MRVAPRSLQRVASPPEPRSLATSTHASPLTSVGLPLALVREGLSLVGLTLADVSGIVALVG